MDDMKQEKAFYTYILANNKGMLYVGITGDLKIRVQQHKEGRGSTYTSKYQCHRLVYYEVFEYVFDAIEREKQIKGYGRTKKKALIDSMNPQWSDVSKDWSDGDIENRFA